MSHYPELGVVTHIAPPIFSQPALFIWDGNFPYGLFQGGENVLVNDETSGQRFVITGQVLGGEGALIPDAMVEIWQAGARG